MFVIFYSHFVPFVRIVGGQPFLRVSDDQTRLQSVVCSTSALTDGVTRHRMHTLEASVSSSVKWGQWRLTLLQRPQDLVRFLILSLMRCDSK